MTGKLRQVFDLNAFIKRHSDIFVPLQQLRKKLNVLVLESRCPVKKALDSARNKAQTGNATERPEYRHKRFGQQSKVGLASKTYQRLKLLLLCKRNSQSLCITLHHMYVHVFITYYL